MARLLERQAGANPVRNVAASVRRRQVNLSQARDADYNVLVTHDAIERFLCRLSKSTLVDRFVLKGTILSGASAWLFRFT